MPELRRDPIVGRWAIISNRGKRTPAGCAYAVRADSFGSPLPFVQARNG